MQQKLIAANLLRESKQPQKASVRHGHALSGDKIQSDASKQAITLHVCFLSTTAAYIGYALMGNSSTWLMGIPRLKFPSQAPSRSTLKLEEAFLFFLDASQRKKFLRSGMRAVDLGASPGGWTWQFVHRNMVVIAVDNGAIAPHLLESGLVEHYRADGFRYQPDKAVDWMVCDIVEQPIRIAELAARWLVQGWCKHALFNLKLPMKKRYQEIKRCEKLIADQLAAAGIAYRLGMKQLYHDREEVTVYVSCAGQ